MRPLPRLVLLGLLLACPVGRVRADDPAAIPVPAATPAPGRGNFALPYGSGPAWPDYSNLATPKGSCPGCEGNGGQHHPALRRWLLRPIGCWTTHQDYGCGNLKSECIFLFGSCRQFYGEPCLKEPPPLPPYPY
jgi:hypothetical protein